MSEIKHTEGPWAIFRDHPDAETRKQVLVIDHSRRTGYSGREIALCFGAPDGSEAYANAQLMAAAPELLEALESIRQYGSDTLSGRADGDSDDRAWQRESVLEMTRRARAAIIKATGVAP